ncbi:MAG: ATP-binding protein [bacterium]
MGKNLTTEQLMQLTINESKKSIPEHIDKADPKVGAIITTKDGEILAKAYRGELRIGEHCEYTLIERKLKDKNLDGCELYVTLEPCVDKARNEPKRGCSTHIYKSRISKVYIGIRDPNPKVENEGANFLASKGIEVIDFPSHLQDEIRHLNKIFIAEKELEQFKLLKEKYNKQKSYLQKSETKAKINQFDNTAVNQFLKYSSAGFSYPSQKFNQWALGFEIADRDSNEMLHPTRLGIILFGKNVDTIYPHTIFKVEINYANGEKEIKDFGGPIVSQLTSILDFIKDKAFKLTIDRSEGVRKEQIDFPLIYLREAIANAIIHRDYENEMATNFLSISPKKIIIRSPGNPVNPLILEDLNSFDAPSISRNPKIMFVFNKMGLAEQRGIGLSQMKHLNELGFPLPTFDLKAGILQMTFGRSKDFIAEAKGIDSSTLSKEANDGLLFIQQNKEVSVSEYAKHFNLEIKTANRRLKNLVDNGLVIKTGEKKGTRYKLK